MDKLITITDKLQTYKSEDISEFYSNFSNFELISCDENKFYEDFLPKLYICYRNKTISKEIVYLTLLASQNFKLLQKIINYDKLHFVLNVDNSSSLYDYYIYEKNNWIYEIINNPDCIKLKCSKEIYNKLLMLNLVQITNKSEISCKQITALLSHINIDKFDEFWKFYVNEIEYLTDIVQFVQKVNKNYNETEIFQFANKHSLLETFSCYLDLKDSSNWEIILKKIEEHELFSTTNEADLFIGFIIISSVILCISAFNKETKPINQMINNIRDKLVQLESTHLQIELLENIFSILFCDVTLQENEIRLILFLLKNVIDDIKLNNNFDSSEYKRFELLSQYLSNALWRLELITEVKSGRKREKNLMKYMLAKPESLIEMCLKQENYTRAYQVIEVFQLNNSNIFHEIQYAEKLQLFKDSLSTLLESNEPIDEFVDNFFKMGPYVNENVEKMIAVNEKKIPYLIHFKSVNEPFMNMMDLAITLPKSRILLKIAKEKCNLNVKLKSNYWKFCTKIMDLSKEVDISTNLILTSAHYPLNAHIFKEQISFYETLPELYDEFNKEIKSNECGSLNKNHSSHGKFLKMNKICTKFGKNSENPQYLQRLFNYLQAFSRIFYIEENTTDIISNDRNVSYFALLEQNRSEIIGKLLFERNLNPTEFEKYFSKLKLDFLYHIVGNCFPTINLHVQENVTLEELYPDNVMYVPSKSIMMYIQKRNWLLALILKQMYKIDEIDIEIDQSRLQTFFNYLKLPKIEHLKIVFDHNDIMTALQNCICSQKINSYFEEQIVKEDLMSISSQTSINSSESVETGEELLEDSKTTNWKALYDIIESIPELEMRRKVELVQSRDNILVNMVHDGFESECYKYTHFISDRHLRLKTISNNFRKWPGKFSLIIIRSEFTRFDAIHDMELMQLHEWTPKIELCEQLLSVFQMDTWFHCFKFCNKYNNIALQKILGLSQIDVLNDFIRICNPGEEILHNIENNVVIKFIECETKLEKVKILLDYLPVNHTINICYNLLTVLRKLEYLQFIADYLNYKVNNDVFLKNVQISLKILSAFSVTEQELLFCLINEPLNIIEVLIMNTKLDKLAQILSILNLEKSDYDKTIISVEKIDELLRKYAEKSLDFRVIIQPNPRLLKTPEHKLMQSLDSLNFDRNKFVMPENVPTKDDWIANDEVLECMCCQQITFSMFNRRHHCRRCGRVICYNCSLKRMLVPTYGDIMVRVCIDCYDQTIGDCISSEKSDVPSMLSYNQEFWLLNDDPEHNKIVREEFSYEHAPSVSLCLSILKYHSKSEEYSKFLLEQCNLILKLLRPNQETIHEIDYLLVIKMLKSLATAAKMLSAEHMPNSDTTVADNILSQVELLELLAERDCLKLMPVSDSCHMEQSILRRLRDELLQREQWHLVLEVSTKAGLDNSGVFAAWGKSCLKAGCLLQAREKFQRCFDKTGTYDALSNYSLDTFSKSRFLRSNAQDRTTEPPLLHEIIQILETKTRSIHPKVLANQMVNLSGSLSSLNQNYDPALTILNKIKNLKEVASGNYYSHKNKVCSYTTRPSIDPIFYEECIYYLNKYGSHLSLLDFMVKHGHIDKALNFIISNKLATENFVEIYMRCLKDGIVNILQENISKIDSSLDLWKDYLKQICCYLEKRNLLHSLYQLQLFMGDYIRAAMTCIRFYEDNVKTFTELKNNVHFLVKAEEHLRQIIEQEQWVEVASMQTSADFEEKSITNPEIVMKMDAKTIDRHIRTVQKQIKVVEFLAKHESVASLDVLKDLLSNNEPKIGKIPTLFGIGCEKNYLAVLVIISGETVEEGFSQAMDLITDFKLRPIKIFCLAGKQLAKAERYTAIQQLVNCIKSSGINDSAMSDMLDEMLTQSVGTLIKANVIGTKVEDLIKLIKDRATKISAYIEAKQLKTAYFLAVKYKRTADIRRIQREAELLNMPSIKALCQKVLQNYAQSSNQSNE